MARTYIVARVWRDYPSDLNAEALKDVGDGDLAVFLEAHAAQWIRTHLTGSGSKDPEMWEQSWAATVPPPDSRLSALLDKDTSDKLGMAWLVYLAIHEKYPESPVWSLLYAADSPQDAQAIAETLAIRMRIAPLVEINIIEQSNELTTAQWLGWERTLEEFEKRHRNAFDLEEWNRWPSHPLKLVRDEVMRLGSALERHRPITALAHTDPAAAHPVRRDVAPAVLESARGVTDPNQWFWTGSGWEIVFEGRRTNIGHLVGLGMIRMLLQRPNEPISVEELVGVPLDRRPAAVMNDPLMDGGAFGSVRDEIRRLQREIEEAHALGDEERQADLTTKQSDVAKQLLAAQGVAGAARQNKGERERLRGQVAAGLKTAIQKLTAQDARLGTHLRSRIRARSGMTPCYQSEPNVAWLVGGESPS